MLVLAGFAVLFVGAGLFLPRDWEVERTLVIAAPAAVIHAELEDLRAWRRWSPWPPAGEADVELRFGGRSAASTPR